MQGLMFSGFGGLGVGVEKLGSRGEAFATWGLAGFIGCYGVAFILIESLMGRGSGSFRGEWEEQVCAKHMQGLMLVAL